MEKEEEDKRIRNQDQIKRMSGEICLSEWEME